MLVKSDRFLVTTTLVFAILMSASCEAEVPESVVSKLEITEPADGDTISSRETTFRGISPELPAGATIWIFSLGGTRYSPLGQATTFRMVQESGLRWQAYVWVGYDTDIGKKFRILALVADERATQEIQAYLEKWELTGNYPGMVNLPEGVEVHAEIFITRE